MSSCLRYVQVGAPDDNSAPLISGFDGKVGVVAEGVESRAFRGGKVGIGARGGEVETVNVPTAIRDEQIQGG